MLQPDARAERITRRLRFAVSDIRHAEEARAITGQKGPRTKEERLDQVALIAGRCGVDPKRVSRGAGYQESVESAGDDKDLTVLFWKICSGMAHGDMWTTFAAAQSSQLPDGSPTVGTFSVSANVGLLLQMTAIAVLMTRQGWQRYDLRSRSAW